MILVVDHDPEVLERAREILNRDRQVFLASTSEQAFEMVERLGFSVVLVDLDMPGDGYALIQKLHDANPELLIIAISGALNASSTRSHQRNRRRRSVEEADHASVEADCGAHSGETVLLVAGGGRRIRSQRKLIEPRRHLLAIGCPPNQQNEYLDENRANRGASKSVSHLCAPIRAGYGEPAHSIPRRRRNPRLHFGSAFQIMRMASSPSISTSAIKRSFSPDIEDSLRIPQGFACWLPLYCAVRFSHPPTGLRPFRPDRTTPRARPPARTS